MAITKDQLLTDIAESTDVPKATARAMLEQLSAIVSDALEHGEELTLPGIGKLKVSERPARTGRNPQTGDEIIIVGRKVLTFKASQIMKKSLNSMSSSSAASSPTSEASE